MIRALIIFLLAFPISASAQDYNDSIAIATKKYPDPDSAQLKILLNYNVNLIYSQPKVAIANFEKFETIAKKINCRSCLLWILKDKAISIKNTGDHNGSLQVLFYALTLATEDTKTKAGILNNIANVYVETKEYAKAILYLDRAVAINEKEQFFNYLGTNYNNLGIAYRGIGNGRKALLYYKKALDIRQKLGRNENLAQSYLNLGDMYSDLGNTDTALICMNEALSICDSLGSEFGLSFVYTSMAASYMKRNDFRSAIDFSKKARSLSIKVNNFETLLNSTELLAEASSKIKDFDAAYTYQKEFHAIKDSVYNVENAKKQATLEYENELNAKKAEQDKKDALLLQEREKERLIRNGFVFGFLVMLLLFGVILNGYRNKRKANRIIAAQKEETEIQKAMLEQKQKEVTDSIQYAQRIQKTLMASEKYIDKNLTRLNKKL